MLLTEEFFLGTKLYYKALTELCSPIAKYLGVTHVIYVNIDKHGRMFSICTNYKWIERFIEEQYYKLDPLMVHPNNIHNGFSFEDDSNDQKFKDIFLYDAVINFNLCHSFAYVEKTTSGGYFSFACATTKENKQIINKLINAAPIIKKIIRDLNKKLIYLTKDLQENTIDLAALKGEVFYSQKGLVFNEAEDQQQKIQLLNEVRMVASNDEQDILTQTILSPQEINCLRIYLATHSMKQVCNDLNLAATTVSSYIENIKKKLKCKNKNELLAKAENLEFLGYI